MVFMTTGRSSWQKERPQVHNVHISFPTKALYRDYTTNSGKNTHENYGSDYILCGKPKHCVFQYFNSLS